jgi:hypothetical protein
VAITKNKPVESSRPSKAPTAQNHFHRNNKCFTKPILFLVLRFFRFLNQGGAEQIGEYFLLLED